MSPNCRLGRLTRRGKAGRSVLVVALVAMCAGAAAAGPSRSITGAELEKLMVKVKAEHAEARILKVEREAEGGGPELYEVKLLRPDGQVLKLYFDVESLAPVARGGLDDGAAERRRLRERGHGRW